MNIIKLLAANPVTESVDNAINNSGLDTDIASPIQIIANGFIGLIGVVAVVMLIIGAFNMQASQGDPGKVKKAKDTIMYGIIGLVVAVLAFSIVNFVLSAVF